ncbi:ATP phosphoribosyltransferase regulatory subunit [Desulfurella sp.]|uniref:ATP phosphoribosyltransferase regulatory subunit n=1 Tax=Desulfurella sp. TaxID=1962857 RepID=UPI0025BE75C8|nr:ATP phosphoribosyltransferase regulatory subunit [Desulfurella sp.]
MSIKHNIPKGVLQFFYPYSRKRRDIENKIMDYLDSKDYKEIVTPTFIYEDNVYQDLYEPLKSKLFKFVDRNSGKTIILRPDVTLQVALAVLLADIDLPARFSYAHYIYRDEKQHANLKREFKQIGAEVFGQNSIETDIEIITLAIDVLNLVDIKDLVVRISDSQIIDQLLNAYLNPQLLDKKKAILRLINKKNLSFLKQMPLGEFGSIIDVLFLRDINALLKIEPIKQNVENLIEISKKINRNCDIFLDFFYCEYPIYHSGVSFDIFSNNAVLCTGGRYGNLMQLMGKYIPATGFAINLDKLMDFLYTKEI